MNIDLSCDLGEGEPAGRTRSIVRSIHSANIACGAHAGNLRTMQVCLRLCLEHGVRAGAHPGHPSRATMGRGEVSTTPDELRLLVLQQVAGLALLARGMGVPLTHVKLHGTLYHATDRSPALARAYLETVRDHFPGLVVVARLGGAAAALGRRLSLEVWPEAFADRRYQPDGSLVPRGEPGACLVRLEDVRRQVADLREQGLARTICIHGDAPTAPLFARHLAGWLRN